MAKPNSSTAPWKGSVWVIGRNLSFIVVAVVESPSRVQLFATPWTAARQASLSLTIPLSLQYCSLQHRSLFSSPDISTTGYHFLFGPPNSFFLELIVIVLQSSPGACWTPSALGGSSSGVTSLCLLIQFMGFSRQGFWSGLPFPPPVDHVLSEFSTMTCQSWVALHSAAQSFTELHKAVISWYILL